MKHTTSQTNSIMHNLTTFSVAEKKELVFIHITCAKHAVSQEMKIPLFLLTKNQNIKKGNSDDRCYEK